MAQCVQDLSVSECQDCLMEATGRLRNDCGSAAWGDMYLAKCYARYSERGFHWRSDDDYNDDHDNDNDDDDDDNDVEKILTIIIGLIAGVALIIVFLWFLRKL